MVINIITDNVTAIHRFIHNDYIHLASDVLPQQTFLHLVSADLYKSCDIFFFQIGNCQLPIFPNQTIGNCNNPSRSSSHSSKNVLIYLILLAEKLKKFPNHFLVQGNTTSCNSISSKRQPLSMPVGSVKPRTPT